MIVGTAGHIDHGKTALVGALTGVDTDRLKEEKARGISIDLGFAYLAAPSGAVIGFVDVPGHERFIRNMLAGAAGIDFVMLVVAADDGIMPQTREHLAIVDLLGVTEGLVVLTKQDRVSSGRLAELAAEVADLLAGTGLAGAETVAVSNVTGAGIEALRERLYAAAAACRPRDAAASFRLAIDRSFSLAGAGTIVTGTVLSGRVAVGDRVLVSPAGHAARVRSIHAQSQPRESGCVGERAALNLVGESIGKETIRRGDMVLEPWLHSPASRIDARLRLLASETRKLARWLPVRLYHAAAEVPAAVVSLDDAPLLPGDSGWVQLVLERPIAAASGDRFILREANASRTIGGGRLIDLRAPARRRRAPERLAALAALAAADPAEALARAVVQPPFHVELLSFARDRALPMAAIESIVKRLGLILLSADGARFALAAACRDGLRQEIVRALATFHAENPDWQGMAREQLRCQLGPRWPAPVFAALLEQLAASRALAIDGAWVRLPTHLAQFSTAQASLWQRVQPMLDGGTRFRPPRVRDIAGALQVPDAEVRRLLKVASRMGEADEVTTDHFFLRRTMAEIVAIAGEVASAAPGHAFAAAALRDRLGNGRKVAIQLLEFLDRHRVTLRRADLRRIDAARRDLFGWGAAAGSGKGIAPGGVSGLQIRKGP